MTHPEKAFSNCTNLKVAPAGRILVILGIISVFAFSAAVLSGCANPCKNYVPCCGEVTKIDCGGDQACIDGLEKLKEHCKFLSPTADQCQTAFGAINSGLGSLKGADVSKAKAACSP